MAMLESTVVETGSSSSRRRHEQFARARGGREPRRRVDRVAEGREVRDVAIAADRPDECHSRVDASAYGNPRFDIGPVARFAEQRLSRLDRHPRVIHPGHAGNE